MGISVWRVAEERTKYNGVNTSGNGQGPKSEKDVGNGSRMAAKGCQGSPEVPVDLKRSFQPAPGPGGAANGQIRRNRPPSPSTVWSRGIAQPLLNPPDAKEVGDHRTCLVLESSGSEAMQSMLGMQPPQYKYCLGREVLFWGEV